jgi:4-hydroxybenzoate polyprenyltransferase
MIRDYIEISRFFNMGLTGIAPVLGALSMWNIGTLPFWQLGVLFLIGCFAHAFGFVLNDIVDIDLDKLSKELNARPLVNGKITRKNASIFTVVCLIISLLLCSVFFKNITQFSLILGIIIVAYLFGILYDFASKKYPGMDIFVALAVAFLILFGASTIGTPSTLAWIVALIGGLQVLFMNMINGAIKDIDHDKEGLAHTIAICLGAKIHNGFITLPLSFKAVGLFIEIIRIFLVFIPFIFLILQPAIWQISLLAIFAILTVAFIMRLYAIKTFDRKKIRKHIGIIVILMYASAPIMLSSLNVFFILLACIPPLWFISSNLLLYKTALEPKTM